jgi:hypothetical protein
VYSERIDLNWQVRAKGRKVRIKADVAEFDSNIDECVCKVGPLLPHKSCLLCDRICHERYS